MRTLPHAEALKRMHALSPRLATEAKRVALLMSCTLDFMRPHLVAHSADNGQLLDPWLGPYNQFEQLVFDPASALWAASPAVVVIFLRLEDLDPWLGPETRGVAPADARARLDRARARALALAAAVRERFSGPILVTNFTLEDQGDVDPFEASDPLGLTYLISDANRELALGLRAMADAHVLDYRGAVAAFGAARFRDERLFRLARAPGSVEAQSFLAAWTARTIVGLLRPPAKCIVVDLDNTLWGGVLGDDGVAGLQLGDEHPGSSFKAFQALLLGYRRRGFLLAICSKNDDSTVRTALEEHPDMLLRGEHFAAIQANWDPKPLNLQRIAETLNIGLDALVFVDDNPVERATVRAALPMVEVVELPEAPHLYAAALRAVRSLDRPRVLAEDADRAAMYAADHRRRDLEAKVESVDQFLAGLEMVATIGAADEATLPRIHQLVGKTNQFNLTTRRHSLEDLRRMNASGRVAWLRLRDRFGDLGLVAVATLVPSAAVGVLEIDSFVMSCRVMGRRVEDALLAHLAEVARALGATALEARYLPTKKNHIVERFYVEHGFEPTDTPQLYRLALSAAALPWPAHVQQETSS